MGFLSFVRDERVALLGIGLAATALISGMMTLVSVVIEDNKIDNPAPKTQYITQETEDSLQVDTLDKLLNHPSFSIREVAIKILCDRAVNDPDALHELLYGITREDYDHRLQCLKALTLLLFQTNGMGTSTLGALPRDRSTNQSSCSGPEIPRAKDLLCDGAIPRNRPGRR